MVKQSQQRADAAAANVKELQAKISDIETFHLQAAYDAALEAKKGGAAAKKGGAAAACTCKESPSGNNVNVSIKLSPVRAARSAPARASNISATGSPFNMCFNMIYYIIFILPCLFTQ